MTRGKRRSYIQEYKEEAVKLVTEHGYKISDIKGVRPGIKQYPIASVRN